jgi:hypothetical protein
MAVVAAEKGRIEMKKAICLGLLLVTALAMGQEGMQPTPPAPELKKLEFMVGSWKGTFTVTMGGQEMQMACTAKIEWVHKGNFLRTDMTVDMGEMGKSQGISYTSYDPKTKSYVGYGFEDISPQPREETGKFEGTKFVSISKPWEVMGTSMPYRSTFESKPDGLYMLLEMKQGDEWVKMGESTLKKQVVEKTTDGAGAK